MERGVQAALLRRFLEGIFEGRETLRGHHRPGILRALVCGGSVGLQLLLRGSFRRYVRQSGRPFGRRGSRYFRCARTSRSTRPHISSASDIAAHFSIAAAAAMLKWVAMSLALLMWGLVLLLVRAHRKYRLPRLPNGLPDWRTYLRKLPRRSN